VLGWMVVMVVERVRKERIIKQVGRDGKGKAKVSGGEDGLYMATHR